MASVNDKLTCTDNMTNTDTFTDATGAAETTGGLAKFTIENGAKLDENSKYYVEIMNVGTGEIFKSDIMTMNQLVSGSGSSTPSVDLTNINVAGVVGDFSTKGNLVTINGTQYRVLAVNGSQVKVMSMVNIGNSTFNDPIVTTPFRDEYGQKYADSDLDQAMANCYNGLPAELQNAIVEQNILQSMYKYSSVANVGADFSSWYVSPFTDATTSGHNYYLTRTAEINVGTRKVFALDVDDVISYLGSNSTAKDVNEMFFGVRSSVISGVWLRSANSGGNYYAFYVNGGSGCSCGDYYNNSYEVRPAFVLDLSLLS